MADDESLAKEMEEENEEKKELDLSVPDVVSKYKLAAEIANSKSSSSSSSSSISSV
jgi:hypothetical protein